MDHVKPQHVQEALMSLLQVLRETRSDISPLVHLYALLRESNFNVSLAYSKILEGTRAYITPVRKATASPAPSRTLGNFF